MSVSLRDASTVVVLRRGSSPFEVLLLRRHSKSRFMPGAYVFPGGAVDSLDADESLRDRLFGAGGLAERLGEPNLADGAARGLFVAAVRETLEEANILLGTPSSGQPHSSSGKPRSFLDAVSNAGSVDLARLHPWFRWITPRAEPRRFDTRFFLAEVSDDQAFLQDGQETTDGLWIAPSEALDRAVGGDLPLPPPTLRSLELLEEQPSLEALLTTCSTRTPPVVEPIKRHESGSPVVYLPGDEAHPIREPIAGLPTRMHWADGYWQSRSREH